MGLEMKPGAKHWYAKLRINRVVRQLKLETQIMGKRPRRLSENGDHAFERSRGAAQKEFEQKRQDLLGDPTAEKALQRLVEIKTGKQATFPKMAELPALWAAIPRRRDPNERYAQRCKGVLKHFAEFVAAHQPSATEFVKVTPETAKAFLDAEAGRNLSQKTWNDTLKLLRTTFKRLHPQLHDGSNPFHEFVTKATETINRTPYTIPEMKAILEASEADPFIGPIIITGMCTAMRRGDCCLLRWKDVNLAECFLRVKTSKTGETVEIPIFPILYDVLKAAQETGQENEFCFPEAAEMYQKNPDGITWRVKQVLTAAFRKRAIEEGKALPILPAEEVKRRGENYLAKLKNSKRTTHMRQVFELYTAGKNINEVMAETRLSRGSVSGHLNNMEQNIGCAFIRGKVRGTTSELLQDTRENGARRASVRDFHSFRVTWITLALAAGVPLEIVQRVTGHRTAAIVLKHYFRPGREDFRKTILSAMPELLTASTGPKALLSDGSHPSPNPTDPQEEALKALEGMNSQNWEKQRDIATSLIRQAMGSMDGEIVREMRPVEEETY